MKSETFKELKQLLLANGIKKLCQENELNEFIGILILNEALSEQAAEELVNEEIQSDLIELFIEKLFQSFPQIYTSSLKRKSRIEWPEFISTRYSVERSCFLKIFLICHIFKKIIKLFLIFAGALLLLKRKQRTYLFKSMQSIYTITIY